MIGKKINQLATELAPVSTDLTIIGDPISGVSKKITLAQLGAIFSGAVSFYNDLASFPTTGDINVIYCAKDTQKLYLWSGSAYTEVFPAQALLDTYQLRSEKGVSNGYASLDSTGKVPISQLPSSIMEYKGTWNAATNTPTLANGTGDTGDVYICNVAGTVNFGAGPITFAVGDYVIYSGSIWQRSSGAVGTVTSVGLSTNGNSITIGSSPVTTSGTISANFVGNSTQYINGAGNLTTFPTLTGYVPYTGATANVDLGTHTLLAKDLVINHSSGSGVAASITKGGAGEALTVVKSSGSGNAASITGGVTLLDELHLNTDLADTYIASASNWNAAYNDKINSAAVTGTTTKTLTLTQQDGGTITASWTDDNTDAVTSVFGRTGAVVAVSGDYNTSQVTENTNLYFTNARAIASTLTGYTSGAGTISATDTILSAIQKLNGNIGALTTGVSSVNGLTGAVTLTTSNIAEGTNLYYTEARVSANTDVAANTAARHNAVTIGTANGLSLSTQVLSLALASGSTTGALSSTDWTTFNNKQNALTNPVTGTGTTNYLPKFTGTSTIGNSNLVDVNGYMILGAATSTYGQAGRGTFEMNGSADNIFAQKVGGSLAAYFYTNATNLEIYSTNYTVFSANGAERMRLNASGNLSIGNTNNTYKLDVTGTGRFQASASSYAGGSLILTSSAGTNPIYLTSNGGYFALSNGGGADHFLLALTGAATFSSSVTATQGLTVGSLGSGSDAIITLATNASGSPRTIYYKASTAAINFTSTAGSDLMTLTNGGSLGIGTTSPAAKLQVDGVNSNGLIQAYVTSGGGSAIRINSNFVNGNYIDFNPYITGVANGGFEISQNGTQRFVISTGGNVGIGTTSPNGKLTLSYSSALVDGLIFSNTATNGRQWRIGDGSGAGAGVFGIYDATAAATRMVIASTGEVEIGSSFKTGEPDTGYGRAAFKIGTRQSGTATDSGGYIPISIDGTVYFINLYTSTP